MSTVHYDTPYSAAGDMLVWMFVIGLIVWAVLNYLESRDLP